ncbi:gluconate 2-dehydrogenase subunit 3 family protein [Halapricum sp. CBA1109]|uniref:gluconate 2-dehydrogenase subunit 3 family protein n=1 Tax=Halapricum sp. CBA1109 TaxID=2668068 RepID=UPI0012F8AFF8|nr:gluconate 2-dehydrogenase subunit 3 family protein [Halapricum sp. CBA1109]MUV90451.1 gluconate 2-dehydrogenase subunit 3 family protein [Halapricum sp. CBA1109]
MSPELTRRDAIVALGATGVATAGLGALVWDDSDGEGQQGGPSTRETAVAAAEALYPTDVTGIEGFVETYVLGRIEDRPTHREGLDAATTALEEYAQNWEDTSFTDLSRTERQDIFDSMGVDGADPDPSGSQREQVRYYVVNDLLFALYSSPTGGRLVGLENPQGHPGGSDSYRRGPE